MANDINEELSEATVDFIETPQGNGFVIDNPSEMSGCGSCGGSCH
jgi:Fe-S cluster assembly iron-binding protein IscA